MRSNAESPGLWEGCVWVERQIESISELQTRVWPEGAQFLVIVREKVAEASRS